MKKLTTTMMMMVMMVVTASAQKLLGGDLSLVPAYEQAGDVWLDAEGDAINSKYADGMITYMRDVAKWNSVRVRLIVDAAADDKVATCQDLDYVKKLGKRIKDAGMNFLLDIFYSDTWTDVKQQWIPVSWGMDRTTATDVLAAKVKSYTTEVLNELVAYGATPDYVQIGNEVSYGMLWDSYTTKSNGLHFFNLSGTYANQKIKIDRFATLLKAAAEGVRASNCGTAKIVLHCERTEKSAQVKNFYDYVAQGGFTDYDIIGLSYYPFWHGTLTNLSATLATLQSGFPNKEIHIVEIGYFSNNGVDASALDYNTSDTWAFSPAGQAQFLSDVVAELEKYSNVKALYYWQPEECGNGADNSDVKHVMDDWDNRGFWNLSYKSGSHTLIGAASIEAMKAFIGEQSEKQEETDFTGQFVNMDFTTTDGTGWTVCSAQGWGSIGIVAVNEWHSSLVSGSCFQSWVSAGSSLAAGEIFSQSADNMPAGTYTVKVIVHTDYNGIYLFANDDAKVIPATSTWGTAFEVSVTTTLATAGKLTIGLKLAEKPTSGSEINIYADNFKVTGQTTGIRTAKKDTNQHGNWYTLDGRQSKEKPAAKGVYIHNGRKVVVK